MSVCVCVCGECCGFLYESFIDRVECSVWDFSLLHIYQILFAIFNKWCWFGDSSHNYALRCWYQDDAQQTNKVFEILLNIIPARQWNCVSFYHRCAWCSYCFLMSCDNFRSRIKLITLDDWFCGSWVCQKSDVFAIYGDYLLWHLLLCVMWVFGI